MNTKEILRQGRERVTRGWCQGPPAIDDAGSSVLSNDPSAVAWCIWGAVADYCFIDDPAYERAVALLDKAAQRIGYLGCIAFNEAPGRTQADAIALYDDAISLVG